MYAAVQVKVKDNGTYVYLDGLAPRAQKIGKRETWNLTQFGSKMMRESHSITSEHWKGQIRAGITAKKLGENQYGIEFTKEAMGLDRMTPHWVSLKPGRDITEWAKARGLKGKAVFVHPHPYIELGFQQMVNRLDIVANRIANEIVG